ncbi:hypothetical protein Hanom_Chr05g00427901 [Helianthus anomalus]
MQFIRAEDGVLREKEGAYEGTPWYEALTTRLKLMWQLEEYAFVAAGMSMLWAPENLREASVYGYDGRDQIRDFFHHPTDESLASFANTRTCVHPSTLVKPKTDVTPSGEEITILSSEGYVVSSGERLILIPRSTHVGASGDQTGRSNGHIDVMREGVIKSSLGKYSEPGSGKHSMREAYLDYVVVSNTLHGLDVGMGRLASSSGGFSL